MILLLFKNHIYLISLSNKSITIFRACSKSHGRSKLRGPELGASNTLLRRYRVAAIELPTRYPNGGRTFATNASSFRGWEVRTHRLVSTPLHTAWAITISLSRWGNEEEWSLRNLCIRNRRFDWGIFFCSFIFSKCLLDWIHLSSYTSGNGFYSMHYKVRGYFLVFLVFFLSEALSAGILNA